MSELLNMFARQRGELRQRAGRRMRFFGQQTNVFVLLVILQVLVTVTGCSKTSDTPDASDAATTPATAADPSTASDNTTTPSTTASTDHARDEVWVDDKGQKWLGKVPFDAFFDEPYAIASNQTPLGGVPAGDGTDSTAATASIPDVGTDATAPRVAMTTPPPADTTPVEPTSPTGDGWADLITPEALDEEVKSIRNFMNENLQSVGSFNSAMLMLPPKAAALAALAEVAGKHPQAVSWKDDAPYIRDLAKQMNSSALQRGAKDQKRLLALFESVSDTLNRSRPAGLTEPPADDSFAEAAEMRLVMMRMEEAEKKMRTEAGSEAAFSSKKLLVAHEAALLGVMAKVVTEPGYGYADDPEFTGYGKSIIEAAQSIKIASESSDFAAYETALSKISTTCQNCHSKYKND